MWAKFSNSSVSMREVIITSILKGFDQKNQIFAGVLLVQVQWFETVTSYDPDILNQCGQNVKTKSHKDLGAHLHVCRRYGGIAPKSWKDLTVADAGIQKKIGYITNNWMFLSRVLKELLYFSKSSNGVI